ncbi:hypothetical protein BZG36_05655 [Bifiguratus adelaidae]|uniref:Uncharacterized protein n=1 Tax=Bifiguratus adelaidae TaxID=1938954 RepID=A0A261XT21_9FUNG|nr:hypothetical protein BZG36_05655 [Bifiguratus adelaidae]
MATEVEKYDVDTMVEKADVELESGTMQKLKALSQKLDALGIEARGIEISGHPTDFVFIAICTTIFKHIAFFLQRVSEDARTDRRLWHNGEVWLAANCVIPSFGIGILGPSIFGLGLGDSCLTIVFVNLFSTIFVAFISTFGPKLGLRQMVGSRYSWGWYGVKIVAVLNSIGWSAINTVAGGQILSTVADQTISNAVGIVIVALCTLVVGFAGYKYVHVYERYSWIPTTIAFFIMLGLTAKQFVDLPMTTGETEAGDVLSFAGTL